MNADLYTLRFKEVYQTEHDSIMSDFDEEMESFYVDKDQFDGYSVITEKDLFEQQTIDGLNPPME